MFNPLPHGWIEARYVHEYQKDNPERKVSLQADEDLNPVKDTIKAAAKKALKKFFKTLVVGENDM